MRRMMDARSSAFNLAVALITIILLLAPIFAAADSGTLDRVRSRKVLRCGVSEGVEGFSIKDTSGKWTGMDADFCRAVAAAAGPNIRVEFVPLTTKTRFLELKTGTIDLLCRNTTWTLGREIGLDVSFAGVLFFDAQGFMVAKKSGIKRVSQLQGATVCVKKDTTTLTNLEDFSRRNRLNMKPLQFDTQQGSEKAFFSGRCKAFTSDHALLVAARRTVPGGTGRYMILPETIAKEPTGPAVRRGDDQWLRLVKWVLYSLVEAEERGITRANAANMQKTSGEPAVRRLLGAEGDFGRALGTDNEWALRAIQASGNYGEMFERNLGRQSALNLDRRHNKLWSHGGLMWAPPFR